MERPSVPGAARTSHHHGVGETLIGVPQPKGLHLCKADEILLPRTESREGLEVVGYAIPIRSLLPIVVLFAVQAEGVHDVYLVRMPPLGSNSELI